MLHRALLKTHHMTSRKKIQAISKAAKSLSCAVVIKTGHPPGVMIAECECEDENHELDVMGKEENGKKWVAGEGGRRLSEWVSAVKKIEEKLKNHVGRSRIPTATPGAQKMAWTRSLDADLALSPPLPLWSPWSDEAEGYGLRRTEVLPKVKEARRTDQKPLRKGLGESMGRLKKTPQSLTPPRHKTLLLDKKRIQLHAAIAKAESSPATPIRTEKNWIRSVFLHQRESPRDLHGRICQSGWAEAGRPPNA
ncbi:hypothetical protein MMC22_008576 [Lobaria immixta]|nr:hypothetical protein [Lobaria immixta]